MMFLQGCGSDKLAPLGIAVATAYIHDATTPASGATPRRPPQHCVAQIIVANMATGRAPSSTPVPTTETAETTGATSTVTAQEWEAMANFLKSVYDYRIHTEEYALTSAYREIKANKHTVARSTTPPNSSSAR
jgi:hypothetical protein